MGKTDLSLFVGQAEMGSHVDSAVGQQTVVTFETTAAGIAYLDSDEPKPGSVVTDHDPPDRDCFELLEAVPTAVPVVVAPTRGSSELATRACRAGAAGYVDLAVVENDAEGIAAEIARARKQHAAADERIDQFASLVSHELRSPIQTARSGIDLANAQCDSKYLDEVGETLDQMESLIDNLLDRLQQEEPRIELTPVDLSAVVESAWSDEPGARLSVESELPTIAAEESRVRQLFENLFRNSIQHGPPSSATDSEPITVRVGVLESETEGTIGLYIADNGQGIDPDHRTKVFEYGYTRSEHGSGFGLAIVKEVADAFGWDVELTESRSGGVRFEFRQIYLT